MNEKQRNKPNTIIDSYKKIKEAQKLSEYVKDLESFLKEPTKGNAIRLISKRVLKYVLKVGGGPGTIINKMYGHILAQFIDALYFYEQEIAIQNAINEIITKGKEAKENADKGLKEILRENEFIRNQYMPTVWQYCFLLAMTDPQYQNQYPRKLEMQLVENTRKRIKEFDNNLICFLAADTFIKSIPKLIEELKKELKDPTNRIEQSFRSANLHTIELITLEMHTMNFGSGIGDKIDKYIKLRNEWALWINYALTSRATYEEAALPEMNLE